MMLALLDLTMKVVCPPFSRVLAVTPDGTLRWFVPIRGYVEGTPVIGVNGTIIYVSHNARDENGEYQGFITVIGSNTDGTIQYEELSPANRKATFGPLAIRTDSTGNDVVVWAENTKEGYDEESGQIYFMAQNETGDLGVTTISNTTFSSTTRPALLNNNVWMGGHASRLTAWNVQQEVDSESQLWTFEVQPTERNISQRKSSTLLLLFLTGF